MREIKKQNVKSGGSGLQKELKRSGSLETKQEVGARKLKRSDAWRLNR
jgi:hypothetical protein